MSDTVPQNTPQSKHYVYILAYPESMGGYVFYVGKGVGNRINRHEVEARNGNSHNSQKTKAISKIWDVGEKVVKNILARFETHKEACMYEIALIFFMSPYEHLTNLTDGGEGPLEFILSEEYLYKLGKGNRGRKLSEEHCAKISKSLEGNSYKKGKRPSEATRRKMSESGKRRVFSEEHRRKLSESNRRRPCPLLGRKYSEATRQRMSEAAKQREARKRLAKGEWNHAQQLHLFE